MPRRAQRPDRPTARRISIRRPRLEALEPRELLAAFSVTNVADAGTGSLRAAIAAANADTSAAVDTIGFNIAGPGAKTIALLSALPTITGGVAIDGSISGIASPGIVLDGSAAGAGANGLDFTGGTGSSVKGLSVVGFSGGAGVLIGGAATGVTLSADYLGVLPDGTTAKANSDGVVVQSAGNKIGVGGAGTANLISGNTLAGVRIVGASATGNLVSGNKIGTDASGAGEVRNTYGVVLAGANNTVGGTTAATGNLISGNVGPTGQTGIGVLFQGSSTGNIVEGNLIGTDASGTGAVANVFGVYFGTPGGSTADAVSQDILGGTAAGAGNVISGNFIGVTGNVAASAIQGNTIGLALGGLNAVPNAAGILLGANSTTIGGTTASARNVISASSGLSPASGTGLELRGDANLVEGNYIGLSSAGVGLASTANLTGMALHVTNSTIGGTAAGAGNVIANNIGDGLTLDNNGGNLIAGNLFGLSPVTGALTTNGVNAINIILTPPTGTGTPPPLTLNDTIGGTAAGAGNVLTGSYTGSGVVVHSTYPAPVTGLNIRGNSIFGNSRLGIDLNGSNTPIPGYLFITNAISTTTNVTLAGVFHGTPSTSYAIDLFGNSPSAPASPTGFGPGQFFLGSVTLATDGAGFATFNPTFAAPPAPLTTLSGTSTGPDGNTTEFSANFPTSAATPRADLSVATSTSSSAVIVGDLVTLTEKITNNGPSAASGVILADSLPISFVNASATSNQGTVSVDRNNVLIGLIGTVAPGRTVTITIVGAASQQGFLVDNPGVSSTTLDPNYANNEASQSITVTPLVGGPNADLAITKMSSPATARVGDSVTYTVTVTNKGPATATNVTANDFLPAGLSYVSATPSQGMPASVNGSLIADNLGTIAPGASATLTIVTKVTASGTITNAANVSGNQFDPTPANNSTQVSTIVAAPSINLLLSAATTPVGLGAIGQIQLFTLTVTNNGLDPSTNTTIIDTLPAGARFVNAAPSQGGFASLNNGVLVDNLGTIAPGASATLRIYVIPTTPGAFINFAGAYSPDFPSATPSFAYGAVYVPVALSGPSVIGLAGTAGNSRLFVPFNLPLNTSTATDAANYSLTGSKGKNRKVNITQVAYNAATNSVSVFLATPLDPTQTYAFVVRGSSPSGVRDTQGRLLVGTLGGTSGTNYTATFLGRNLPQI